MPSRPLMRVPTSAGPYGVCSNCTGRTLVLLKRRHRTTFAAWETMAGRRPGGATSRRPDFQRQCPFWGKSASHEPARGAAGVEVSRIMTQVTAPPRKVQLEDLPIKLGMTRECVPARADVHGMPSPNESCALPALTRGSLPPRVPTERWRCLGGCTGVT